MIGGSAAKVVTKESAARLQSLRLAVSSGAIKAHALVVREFVTVEALMPQVDSYLQHLRSPQCSVFEVCRVDCAIAALS